MSRVSWIKVETDCYKNAKIRHIRKHTKGGDQTFLIYLTLLMLAGMCNRGGKLMFTEAIPYDSEKLSEELGFKISQIECAMTTLMELEMIVYEDGAYLINGWEEHQNIEGMSLLREKERIKKEKQRARQRSEKASAQPPREEVPTQTKPTNKDHTNEVIFTDD